MGGAGFPPCWLFGLRHPNTGAYLGSLVGLMTDSGRTHTKEYFPELLLPVSLSPRWATATSLLCRRPSNTSRYVWFSLPWGHCSFPWVLMCTLLCVCPPRVESLFPPVLSKSCNQIPLDFKVSFSRSSSSRYQTPRLGTLTWGSEPSLQWVDFCGISVFQSVSHPPSSYGIFFYCDWAPPTISLWLLLCLWMWGIFFGECLPVNDCPAASCDSGVLTRESDSMSFYSTILLPPPRADFFKTVHVRKVFPWVPLLRGAEAGLQIGQKRLRLCVVYSHLCSECRCYSLRIGTKCDIETSMKKKGGKEQFLA